MLGELRAARAVTDEEVEAEKTDSPAPMYGAAAVPALLKKVRGASGTLGQAIFCQSHPVEAGEAQGSADKS